MSNHTHHLTNLDAADVPRYQQAIEQLGVDLSIRPGAFDCYGRMWNADRYSLWCPILIGDLSKFWKMVEGR